jgi:hypothetical protein
MIAPPCGTGGHAANAGSRCRKLQISCQQKTGAIPEGWNPSPKRCWKFQQDAQTNAQKTIILYTVLK